MNPPEITSEIFGVMAKAMVENANRLGLTWVMRRATVVNRTPGTIFITAQYDGDATPIGMVNLIGGVSNGARVYVLQVPPSGNYVIGSDDYTDAMPPATTSYNPNGTISGTTTSAAYAAYPGSITLSLDKRYEPGKTQLLFQYVGTMWCNGATGTQVKVGVTVNGTDFDMSFLNFNVAASHVTVAGARQIDANPGLASYPLRWLRFGGTGTLTIDAADFAAFSVQEVAII